MASIIIFCLIILGWTSLILALVLSPLILAYLWIARRYGLPTRWWLIIGIIIIASIPTAIRMGSYPTAGTDHIRILKPLSVQLSSYRYFEVVGDIGEADDPARWLVKNGLERANPGIKPNLRVVLKSKVASLLTFNWHALVPMFEKNLKYVKLTLENAESHEVIGEVEYERPFYMGSMNEPCYEMLTSLVHH